MTVFKRTKFNLYKNVIITIIGMFGIGLIAYVILENTNNSFFSLIIAFLIATSVYSVLIWEIFYKGKIKFEVTKDSLIFYRNNKIVQEFNYLDHDFSYRTIPSHKEGKTDIIVLIILNLKTQADFRIECEPIGREQFAEMISLIRSYKKGKKQK